MRSLVLCLFLALSSSALAQESTVPVPQKHIPSPVLLELRALERQFDLALVRDCATERCVSKGCVYRDHVVVDMPRASSLPGIGQSEGPGSVPAQEYLTEASCDFAHEKAVASRDVQALVRRLEQRLSKGWLKVSVGHQVLAPISPTLSEPPAPKPEPVPEPPRVETPPLPSPPPAQWDATVAQRELWVSLLPHFSWMIALVLGTLAALLIIWALRRLGKESLEEKAMLAQMTAGTFDKRAASEESAAAGNAPATDGSSAEGRDEAAFVAEQRRLWASRMTEAELTKEKGVVVELLRQWLKAGEFELLAKAIFLFGDKLSSAFSSEGELAVRKVGFAEFLRHVDEQQLPTDAAFFRKLNHHAISASLLSQSDAESYRSIHEEFGSSGIAHLIESLTPRHGALLFALVPPAFQHEVARTLSPELQVQVASQLLSSNRMSNEEQGYLFEALDAARAGRSLPAPPRPAPDAIRDRGHAFDAAGALSVLLTYVGAEDRQALLTSMLKRSSGAFPSWYQDILYPDMLLKLPQDLQADMLLEVDVQGLAGWYSVQHPAWRESFISKLAPSMQNAVRANMAFSSPADQFRMARRGHDELVSAVKRLVAGGRVSFTELVA
ncbi:hypothetical protein [Hyalangium rubrum]|uniref:Flagellar motor switch protein FliG C-terminal domain-containing protein n=1 Tax=Hyalangium rubrum TaxID=3103134 RepID=A0ABU5GZF6_9BACT|nr:hypothetical protein [Hyalangium sp. s54d21]MDY7226583.1 hypothetical protein [Hyalangium sp. s54d21]